jgi:hypothetical protein
MVSDSCKHTASDYRRELMGHARSGDVDAVRQVLERLYDPADSPFAETGSWTASTFSPLVDAAFVAKASEHDILADELMTNVRCMADKFGVPVAAVDQVEACLGGLDVELGPRECARVVKAQIDASCADCDLADYLRFSKFLDA